MSNKVTFEQQLVCAKRELGLRHSVYPRLIEQNRMTQGQANDELDAMRGIVETLQELVKQNKKLPLFN